ncbi:MAG: Zn-ribbon domain-containing OB-fold protein [Methanocellales archaeon]|nr:Zn-ribbon domain-containing OB-fold protein [Methanocellales archaeon]
MAAPRFWRHIPARYNLIGTKCLTCGEYYFPPRTTCPACRRAGTIEECKFKGIGEVVTYTVIRSASDAFDRQTPYVLAIVRLEEGPRLTTQIVCDPDEIEIGMKVCAVFRKITEESSEGVICYGTKFMPRGDLNE